MQQFEILLLTILRLITDKYFIKGYSESFPSCKWHTTIKILSTSLNKCVIIEVTIPCIVIVSSPVVITEKNEKSNKYQNSRVEKCAFQTLQPSQYIVNAVKLLGRQISLT